MSSLAGLTILLLEDDFLINEGTADLLREFGCSVFQAFSIVEALGAIEGNNFDAAVLDVNINGVQSEAVADRLHDSGVPFLFLTGYESATLRGRWQTHPVCGKPVAPDVLRQQLFATLDRY